MKHIGECPAERATYFIGGKWKIILCMEKIKGFQNI